MTPMPDHPVRFVTAASLFDGHDASINIMRRILQSQGAEVIHLGHNRSVDEVVRAARAGGRAGRRDQLLPGRPRRVLHATCSTGCARRAPATCAVYGGGGGVIVPSEIELLHARGVARIFSPAGRPAARARGMINAMIAECDRPVPRRPGRRRRQLLGGSERALARAITALEDGDRACSARRSHADGRARAPVPVLGITGTGGSGKSSLTDELLRRFRLDQDDKLRIAVIAIDPTRRRGGGALLGDRIRMNAIDSPNVFFRSLATRGASEVPECTGATSSPPPRPGVPTW